MYAVFMKIHMTHGRFDGYPDDHIDCCEPQSSLIHGVIGLEVARGLGRESALWRSCRRMYSAYEALSKSMCPKLNVQRVGGGVRACACNCKTWWPCMKRTMVFDLVWAAKNLSIKVVDKYQKFCPLS